MSSFEQKENAGMVREASLDDARAVWEMRNDPATRENSNNQGEIPLEQHLEWFKDKYFVHKENLCFVLDEEDKIVGYCRFDLEEDRYVVSIAIDPTYQGRGLGSALLAEALKRLPDGKEVVAEVKADNQGSLKIFEKNNFKVVAQDDKIFHLSYRHE